MTSLIAEAMNSLIKLLTKSGLLAKDLDYHLLRASMVIIFLLFGYQKWFAYEATVLIPFISHDPLISWLYPAFGIPGRQLASRRLWNGYSAHSCSLVFGTRGWEFSELSDRRSRSRRRLALFHSCRDKWDPAAGFPAMAGNIPFLVKDLVLLAVSIYLLKQDVVRVSREARSSKHVPGLAQHPLL